MAGCNSKETGNPRGKGERQPTPDHVAAKE